MELDNITDRDRVRFWSHVDKSAGPEGCWLWTGHILQNGYGQTSLRKWPVKAHRLAYAMTYEDPGARLVMHSCDNPPCVNPAHLSLGSVKDNAADMVAKGRAHGGDKHWTRTNPARVNRQYGEAHPQHRLTAEKVRQIRERVARGEKKSHVAREFGISAGHVTHIISGRAWSVMPESAA